MRFDGHQLPLLVTRRPTWAPYLAVTGATGVLRRDLLRLFIETGPYQSARRPGVNATTRDVYRMMGDSAASLTFIGILRASRRLRHR